LAIRQKSQLSSRCRGILANSLQKAAQDSRVALIVDEAVHSQIISQPAENPGTFAQSNDREMC
jgi:hypothetical protein